MNTDFRSQFPALGRLHKSEPLIYLDGPAGTQMPELVINAISGYYENCNANTHGYFITSNETDDIINWAREQCVALTNAENARCISFGANMTSLAFKLSRAFSRLFEPGDEVLITQLDHEANRGPWLTLQQHGVIVKEINLLDSGKLDYEDAAAKIGPKTKLVCAGWASNILGTINDVQQLRKLTKEVGAWLLVDAVHYAPHYAMDVQELDCDFLLCSAYKFYGPHVGILYCKHGLLDTLETDRLRTAGQKAPERIETGTLNHAALAGVGACIDFMSTLGQGATKREQLLSAYEVIGEYEHKLAKQLADGIDALPGTKVIGPVFNKDERTPTLAFTIEGKTPAALCDFLGKRNICAWDGHFYALRTTEVLDLEKVGGVTRMGIVAYNTEEEMDKTIAAVRDFINQ